MKMIAAKEKVTISKKVNVWLEHEPGGRVAVRIGDANEKNDNWYLLGVNPDGTMYRNRSVPESLGFQLDEQGRIIEGDSR